MVAKIPKTLYDERVRRFFLTGVCFGILLMLIAFLSPAKVLAADEKLSAPTAINEFTPFTAHYSNLSPSACYALKLYNIDTKQYIPGGNQMTQRCYIGPDVIYFSGKFPISEGDFGIEALSSGKYNLSLSAQTCTFRTWGCSLSTKLTVGFTVLATPTPTPTTPPSSPTPGTETCSIGYQSPTLDIACASCVAINGSLPSRISYLKTKDANRNSYANCSDNQMVNYLCNGGLGTQDKEQCYLVQNSSCPSVCGLSTTSSIASSPTPTPPLPPCVQWGGLNGTPGAPGTQYVPIPTESVANYFNDQGKLNSGNAKTVTCLKVGTAIGDISTQPQDFVKSVFSVVLGLAGGIALLLIIVSGYKFMASQGNPEASKAATEQLTSAVIGLLFIIFSFVILQIVGVDILRIPGFNP